MGDGDNEPVENRFRSALGDDLQAVRTQAAICGDVFDDVKRAMENEAWVSGPADTFFSELTGHRKTLETVGDECESAAENRHDAEPDTVPPDDWRAQWYPPTYGQGPQYYM